MTDVSRTSHVNVRGKPHYCYGIVPNLDRPMRMVNWSSTVASIVYLVLLFFFFILRRMGKNKALAHHTSTYFHTRRVSI